MGDFFDFKDFFYKLDSNSSSKESLLECISDVFNENSNMIKVGKALLYTKLPSNVYSDDLVENIINIYESPEGYNLKTSPYFKNFKTISSKGEICIVIYPKTNYLFTTDDLKNLEFIDEIIYLFYSRLRYAELIKKSGLLDTLTSAPNLLGIIKFLEGLYRKGKQTEYYCIFFNIKNLKFLNTSIGMKNVNDLLKEYFKKINSTLDIKNEIIGRAGGDNFIAIIKNENIDSFLKNLEEVSIILPNIKNQNFKISSRAGILKISEKDSMNSIIEKASIALSFAKSIKDTDFVKFNDDMLAKVMSEKQILFDFSKALENEEFIVNYQPKINSSSKKLVGAEALVRWIKNGKVVPPTQFIPVFEKRKEICLLDFYVLERVCKDIRSWIDKGIEPVKISINFSKNHLKNISLDNKIMSILNKYNINAKYIEIELLESSNHEDNEDLIQLIDNLKNKNISISIDDFGKGYSSLSTIRTLNSDVIKIDKSFIDMIEVGSDIDKIMLKNIIQLIKDLNLEIIAEGVETSNQVDFLHQLGCDIVQGYFFDKPLSYNDFEKRLINKVYE